MDDGEYEFLINVEVAAQSATDAAERVRAGRYLNPALVEADRTWAKIVPIDPRLWRATLKPAPTLAGLIPVIETPNEADGDLCGGDVTTAWGMTYAAAAIVGITAADPMRAKDFLAEAPWFVPNPDGVALVGWAAPRARGGAALRTLVNPLDTTRERA